MTINKTKKRPDQIRGQSFITGNYFRDVIVNGENHDVYVVNIFTKKKEFYVGFFSHLLNSLSQDQWSCVNKEPLLRLQHASKDTMKVKKEDEDDVNVLAKCWKK